MKRLALSFALLALALPSATTDAVTDAWPVAGTFSDMCTASDGGTCGVEVHIVLSKAERPPRFYALVQFGDPALSIPVFFPLERPNYFFFRLTLPEPHAGEFFGQLLPDRLTGTFHFADGSTRSVLLPRTQSYWSSNRTCGTP